MSPYPSRHRSVRSPSFVMVGKHEDEESINCFNIITTMGIPILYALANICIIVGITCMSVVTSYWAAMTPPQCFLYAETPFASGLMYTFGTNLTSCNWVAYGGIPSAILCIVCGILYLFHMKDDKDIDMMSMGVMIGVIVSTIMMLAVVCTLTDGMRVTCAAMSINLSNNIGSDCADKLNVRDNAYNLPVETFNMIRATLATLWSATIFLILVSVFHVVLVVRRRARAF